MKKFLINNYPLFLIVAVWWIVLFVSSLYAVHIPLYKRFLGPDKWANFDGALYLLISNRGYGLYQQAFFPLFPLLIYLMRFFVGTRILAAWLIVIPAMILNIFFFVLLASMDYSRKQLPWILAFFLLFPTTFFLRSVYTESLFLMLTFSSLFAMRKKKFLLASILVGLASATRIVGIFLVPALLIELFSQKKFTTKNLLKGGLYSIIGSGGLISYMVFLWEKYKDPLLFFHVQSAFGANRTNGKLIFLPQVIVRYIKIFFTVNPFSHDYLIALLEFCLFMIPLCTMVIFWKRIRLSYLVFSLCAILLPTLTGTLLSEPRFVLVVFPLFFLLGSIQKNWVKVILLSVSAVLLSVLTAYFLQGYFIA